MPHDDVVRGWKDDVALSGATPSPVGDVDLDPAQYGGLRASSHWFTPTIGCCNTVDAGCDTQWWGGC